MSFSRDFKKVVYWDMNRDLKDVYTWGIGHSGWESDVVLICGPEMKEGLRC